MTVDLKLEKATLFYKSMDNIGENEALLRSSNKFQRMGEGKKKSRLLQEAQQKDFEEIERIKRFEEFEKKDNFIKPQGMSDEEYTRKCIELQAEGIKLVTLDGLVNTETEALGKFAPILIGFLTGLNEVERDLITERVNASVEFRRKTGGDLGCRPKTSEKKEKLVLRLRDEGESYRGIREQTGLGLATIRRIIADRDALLEQSEQVEALRK